MRARELELMLTKWTSRSQTDLDMRGRKLRAANLVPTGGRALNAPGVDASITATILTSALSPFQAIDAVKGVKLYAPMVPLNKSLGDAPTFHKAIEMVLSDPELAKGAEIEFSILSPRGNGRGKIRWTDGEGTHEAAYYSPEDAKKFRETGGDPAKIGIAGTVSSNAVRGGLLELISLAIKDSKAPEGWSGEKAKYADAS